jgi:Chalcone isomerase-like
MKPVVMGLGMMLAVSVSWAALSSQPSPQLAQAVSALVPSAKPTTSSSLTWLGLKVYDAHLWTGGQAVESSNWKQQPFVLELHYLRGLKGKAIAERSAQEMEKLGKGNAAQRAQWLELMAQKFPDVGKHDRLAGVHLPNRGAAFFFNDKLVGEITDPQFAEAFFSIWFDAKTSAPALRQSLLYGANKPKASSQ